MADRRTASAAVTFREKEFVLGMLRQSTTVGNPRGEMGVKDVKSLVGRGDRGSFSARRRPPRVPINEEVRLFKSRHPDRRVVRRQHDLFAGAVEKLLLVFGHLLPLAGCRVVAH